MMSPPPYGVLVTLNTDDPKALAVKAALDEAGIEVSASFQNIAPAYVAILVGLKSPR
jgi:hypothetical protein